MRRRFSPWWPRAGATRDSQLAITIRALERHIHSIFSELDLGRSEQFSRRVKAELMVPRGQVG